MKARAITWAVGWCLLVAAALLGSSCISRIQEERFKPAQPSAALKALATKITEGQTNE